MTREKIPQNSHYTKIYIWLIPLLQNQYIITVTKLLIASAAT